MDAALKTQLDIKNNAEDVQKFLVDMKNWEKEIKEKEKKLTGVSPTQDKNTAAPPPRNVTKKRQQEMNPETIEEKKRIAAYDYRAWDKFDVNKACKDIDGESGQSNSDDTDSDSEPDLPPMKENMLVPAIKEVLKATLRSENDAPSQTAETEETKKLKNIDLAFFEKELGNKFVKEEKWQDAVDCYSKAIELDPSNPIYHANRSLCYIKLSNFKVAEVDSTVALQLDKTYVKAYQRRAFARKALKQFQEAKADYEQVLVYEPKNALARTEITKIEDYLIKLEQGIVEKEKKPTFNPKNMFAKSEKKKPVGVAFEVKQEPVIESLKSQKKLSNKQTMEGVKPPVDVLSKKSVKEEPEAAPARTVSNLTAQMPSECVAVLPILPSPSPHLRSKRLLKKIQVGQVAGESGLERLLMKVGPVEKPVNVKPGPLSETPTTPIDGKSTDIPVPSVPKTCVQFENAWKTVWKHEMASYLFLKSIPCKALPTILGSSLESWLLSQLVSTLASARCLEDMAFLAEFLAVLPSVERFNSLILFLSSDDQKGLEKCFSRLEVTQPEITARLRTQYDL